MRQFRTVFQFEIMSYLRSRPYLISTAALVCLALLLGIIPSILSGLGLLGNDISEEKDNGEAGAPIGIYDAKGTLTEESLDVFLGEGAWVQLDSADPDKISEAVSSGQYSLVLEADGLSYTVTRPGSGAMRFAGLDYDQMIRQGWQSAALKEKGLSQNDIDAVINAAPTAAYVSVGKDAGQSFWLGFILLIALYMAIIMYGQYVMTSVVAEKTSKTVELLITSVKPVYLMFGKVLGAGLAGLMQLCAIILAGTVSLNLSKGAWMAISPSVAGMLDFSTAGSTFFYALIFFLLGFFVFAFLYAAFASTVSRAEDVNTVAFFPMLLFVAAFLVAIMGMTNPAAGYITVCSFIPFLSPLVMFMRICMTDVPFYQILISIVIDIITVVAVGIFSAKLYRTGVLMYGVKPTMRNIWRNIRRA